MRIRKIRMQSHTDSKGWLANGSNYRNCPKKPAGDHKNLEKNPRKKSVKAIKNCMSLVINCIMMHFLRIQRYVQWTD